MKKQKHIPILISQLMFVLVFVICAGAGLTQNALNYKLNAYEAIKNASENSLTADIESQESEQEIHAKTMPSKKDLKDGEYFGSAQGYGGPVKVKLIVESGKIHTLEIVEASGETPAYLDKARIVVDKIVTAGTADVDSVSGATLSSNAIKAATANAIKQAGGNGNVSLQPVRKTGSRPKAKINKYRKPSCGWKDGVYKGSANGFGGTVSVEVTIRNGKIKSISASGGKETPSYWKQALKVKNKIIKKQTPSVDAISGATYSSVGIINATKTALEKAAQHKPGRKSQDISTSGERFEMEVGETKSINAKAKTKLTYRSSNPSIAKVSKKGEITAYRAGIVSIRITAKGNKKYKKTSKTITVAVSRIDQNIEIDLCPPGTALKLTSEDLGRNISLGARAGSGAPLTYTTDAPEVVSVDTSGILFIKATGTAQICISAPQTDIYNSASVVLLVRIKSSDDPSNDPDEKLITGEFLGSGKGYGGKIDAVVQIKEGLITTISVTGDNETDKYWFKAKRIIPKMVSNQTWDVDAISGATISSNGIREAVRQALISSGLI